MATPKPIAGKNCACCKGKSTFGTVTIASGLYWMVDKGRPCEVANPEDFGCCSQCGRMMMWLEDKWSEVVTTDGGKRRARRLWCPTCGQDTEDHHFEPAEYDAVNEEGIISGDRYMVDRRTGEQGIRCGKCGRMAMWIEPEGERPPHWQWVRRVERLPETRPAAAPAARPPAEDAKDAKKRAEAEARAAREREKEKARGLAAEEKEARKREAEEARAAAKEAAAAAKAARPPRTGPPLVLQIVTAPWHAFCRQCSHVELRKDIPKRTYNTLAIATFVAFVATWCILTYGGFVNLSFIPSPSKVIQAGRFLFAEDDFLTDVLWSASRIYGGFAVAACLAIPLGIFMGSFKRIEALISPFCSFVRYMPPTAFVPLIILWFGVGEVEKWVVIFIGVFFYLLVLIVDAVANVEIPLIETAYTLGASKTQVLRKVILPAAWPGIMDALKAMIGAGWTYLIVAELVAAERGIGHMINSMARTMNTAAVMAGIITVGLIGVVTNALFEGAYALLFPWKRKVAAAD
ncbi:MAG: ABC transporter permease [Armatimonadetes bacterium]|nr:ABC transporter permease [Armatimonadota bacterium]